MKETIYDKQTIYDRTDGGWDVFEAMIPQLKAPKKKFKWREDESTPSANVVKDGNVFVFKDFGDNKKAQNCIDFVMDQKGLDFKGACEYILTDILGESIEQEAQSAEVAADRLVLTDKQIQWFNDRGISKSALDSMKVHRRKVNGSDAICFPYYENGEEVNFKLRWYFKKKGRTVRGFQMKKGGKLCFWGIDRIDENTKEAVLVEGETDMLAVITALECAGWNIPVLSVPNGASSLDKAMEANYGRIRDIETFYLFTDNDKPGRDLRAEMSRRLGRHRCKLVNQNEKDACKVLEDRGWEAVIDLLKNATLAPIDGHLSVGDIKDEFFDLMENGLPEGISFGITGLDRLFKFIEAQLTLVTGVPNHGKSAFLDYLVMVLAVIHGMKGAYYSPEYGKNVLHLIKLAEIFTGKQFPVSQYGKKREGKTVMSQEDGQRAMGKLSDLAHWFDVTKGANGKPIEPTPENLIAFFEDMVAIHGIKWAVIDPFNRMKFPSGDLMKHINDFLTDLNILKMRTGLHIFLVAHPKKMTKKKDGDDELYDVPDIYDIAHSSDFANQVDNALTIYRNMSTGLTDVYTRKIKLKYIGTIGRASFNYDVNSGRYFGDGETVPSGDLGNMIVSNISTPHDIWDEINEKPLDIDIPF